MHDRRLNEAICEEFMVWKKNVPFLYSALFTQELESSSYTVQFLPSDNKADSVRVLLGGNSIEGSGFIYVASVPLPNYDSQCPMVEEV
jgi:hypothetical protein